MNYFHHSQSQKGLQVTIKAVQTSLAQSHFKAVNFENIISIRGEFEDMLLNLSVWTIIGGGLCWIALLPRKMAKRHKQVISSLFSE